MDKEQKESIEKQEEEIDWEEFFNEEVDEQWEKEKKQRKKRRSLIMKIIGSILAFSLLISTLQIWFNVVNIPAIRFLEVSQRLSKTAEVSEFKKSVVTIEWDGVKGTGFNIDADGLIVTNDHVVEHTDTVQIHFKEEGSYLGKVIARKPELDLALVEIDATNLPTLHVSGEQNWEDFIDDKITFIGNPLAFTQIANEGTIVDSIQLQDWDVPTMAIDAPIYKGNSGSPVINQEGEVIAIIFATISSDKLDKRVGLAIPSYHLKEMLESH
ncbi:serine protease [Bacillus sp. 7504-2]|nr:serine protease [Bacillus sp. 7504-2]